ncbi:MAG: HAD hydrolase-like protein [Caldilineaceae bacterium]
MQLFTEHVTQRHDGITPSQAAAARYRYANARFREEWHNEHRTPGVTTRIYYAYEQLGLRPRPGAYAGFVREIDGLVRDIEEMEIRIPRTSHRTSIWLWRNWPRNTRWASSPTRSTPWPRSALSLAATGAAALFQLLYLFGRSRASKPSIEVFRQAVLGLDKLPHQIVHVGDRESNDVDGPRRVGMRAILFTGIIDRGSDQTDARRLPQLPGIARNRATSAMTTPPLDAIIHTLATRFSAAFPPQLDGPLAPSEARRSSPWSTAGAGGRRAPAVGCAHGARRSQAQSSNRRPPRGTSSSWRSRAPISATRWRWAWAPWS